MTSHTTVGALRRVIDERALHIVYQPIVDVTTGALFAYEALARAPTFTTPTYLFEAAVSHGCAGELGRVVRELAIEGCPEHRLFLNIHPVELEDGWLGRDDDPIMRHAHPIFLEVTESIPLARIPTWSPILDELRARGIHLAVDDLGAGYSNLKYVADLEPRAVKLDRILIKDLAVNTRVFRLVAGIAALCHELGCLVVAEGIETANEFHAAQLAGVDLAQGYLLGRPDFPLPAWQIPPPIDLNDIPTLRRDARGA